MTNYLSDGQVPIDNNWIENQIRPVALGRKNWLFAGSLRAGKRAAAIMSLVQSAKLNAHKPLAYLKDVLTRLPTLPASRVGELLPHRWQPKILACSETGVTADCAIVQAPENCAESTTQAGPICLLAAIAGEATQCGVVAPDAQGELTCHSVNCSAGIGMLT